MSDNAQWPSWVPDDPKLEPFHKGISAFVNAHLIPPRTETNHDPGGKSIVDPLIGYVHLHPWEVALIDTYLFQRLRRITQVGLAYLVYPTLSYSRFEHTLGVLGNTSKFLARIRELYSSEALHDPHILAAINGYEYPLRLAVLFHDLGHCIFSHVSERALLALKGNANYPSVKYIVAAYTKALNLPKPIAPAEVLSIAICASPEIRHFANGLNIPGKTPELIEKWFEAAGRFIAGSPMPKDGKTIFLAQILSSGLDADKLDYMPRDARLTGIPLGIDLTRLFDKLRVFNLHSSQLPSGLIHLKKTVPSGQPFFVLGLSHGGQFAFEEFCIARASLYDKVYLHQKVRAAEAQLAELLYLLPKTLAHFEECHWWLYLPESVIDHDNLPLPGVNRPRELFQVEYAEVMKVQPLRLRSILKRAFAVGLRNSLSEPAPQRSRVSDYSPTWNFIVELKSDCAAFLKGLKAEVLSVAKLSKRHIDPDDLNQISIDVPDHNRVQQGTNTIYIRQPVTLPRRWALPIDQIAEYYRNRALTYIFAPHNICAEVAIAAEKIIFKTYSLEFEQADFLGDRVSNELVALKERISKTDYYADTPALQLRTDFLRSAEAQEKIAKVVENLVAFESWRKDRVTPSRVSAFLMQFPENIQESALELLTLLRTIEPSTIVEAVAKEYKKLSMSGSSHILVCPLGNYTDSPLPYHMKNLPEMADTRMPYVDLLNDKSIASAERILFFDDNINSGKQTLNILAEWLNIPLPEEVNLHEFHVRALNEQSIEKFHTLPITFVFGVGPCDAKERLVAFLDKYLKLSPANIEVIICDELDPDLKPLTGKNSKLHGNRVELREFLERAGVSLLVSPKLNLERATKRALGVRGTEGVILFPYNVPSMTITALWCAGTFEKRSWTPLCERRRHRQEDDHYKYESS